VKRLKKHTASTITVNQFDDAVYDIIDNIEDAKNSLTKLKNDDINSDARMSQEDLKRILLETKLKLNQA
jgi:septation ring formation regulator EzrA